MRHTSTRNSSLGMQCESVEEFARGTDSKSANLSQIPQSSHSHTANTRIVCGEIQDSKANSESSPKDSKGVSESPRPESRSTSESTLSDSHSISESVPSVIASEAKQSTDSQKMDCHAGLTPARNDRDSESPADSEVLAERHALSAIESHSGDKQSLSPTLKASSGRGDCQGGRERLRNSSPSPLDEKENTIDEVLESKEVKAKDSEGLDSESKIPKNQEAKGGDSEKIDSESKNQASRDTSPAAQYDNNSDSKGVDCHEATANDDKMESCPRTSLESQADSKKIDRHTPPTHKAHNDDKAKAHPLQNLKSPTDSKKQSPKPPTRAGFVATLGRPNAGKSSLLNALLGENLALISHKANATRKQLQLIIPYAPLNAQIIFVDTPGIHHQEKLLNQYMLSQALKAMSDCDLALYLAPITDEVGQYEEFLKLCEGRRHIVLLSKADMCDGDEILSHIARYAPYQSEFLALMPVSVKRGFECEKLLRLIAENLPFSPFYYDSELLSTASTKEIYKELIRESLFENLSDEIPYESDVVIKHFEEKPRLVRIFATIIVEKPSQKAVVIGRGGSGIKRISKHARERLMGLSECAIYLRLDVEVRRGWSKQRESLKKIGYDFAL